MLFNLVNLAFWTQFSGNTAVKPILEICSGSWADLGSTVSSIWGEVESKIFEFGGLGFQRAAES